MGALTALRALIVARHDAATRALQDTLRTLDETGARMKRPQALGYVI